LHRYTHDGSLIHVDQNMVQLLIKLSIFVGSLTLCLLYYTHMKTVCVCVCVCVWGD